MPRKGSVPKRDVLPDPVYHSKTVTKFINKVMLSGYATAKKAWHKVVVYDEEKKTVSFRDLTTKAVYNYILRHSGETILYKDIMRELTISYPTVRDRISKLIRAKKIRRLSKHRYEICDKEILTEYKKWIDRLQALQEIT